MLGEPSVGVEVGCAGLPCPYAEMAMLMVGFREYSGVMSAIRQHEGNLGAAEQVELEHRAPRRHMVPQRADGEDRNANIGQRNRPVAGEVAALASLGLLIASAAIWAAIFSQP